MIVDLAEVDVSRTRGGLARLTTKALTTACVETFVGDDCIRRCQKCGEPVQRYIGADEKKQVLVPTQCKCMKERRRKEEEFEREKAHKEKVKSLLDASGMDATSMASTFGICTETKHNSRQLKICRRYADKFEELKGKGQGLLLYGPVGTGKTHAAACIANALLEKEIGVVMTSFVRVLIGASYTRGGNPLEEAVWPLMRPKLLVVDDLGAERSTGYALEIVYSVIDGRLRDRKPLVLTTNLTLKEMQEEQDIRLARIYDRVFEYCYPVEFAGPSWRKRGASVRSREMKSLLEGEE